MVVCHVQVGSPEIVYMLSLPVTLIRARKIQLADSTHARRDGQQVMLLSSGSEKHSAVVTIPYQRFPIFFFTSWYIRPGGRCGTIVVARAAYKCFQEADRREVL